MRGIPAADPRITAFKGIPFAAPPVGENRWRAPQPVVPWEGERYCAEFAPIAMQEIPGRNPDNIYTREWHVDPDIPMDEDCLYLNVWTPAKTAEERLPVFVWYFGGGLQVGYPAEMEFDGERLARRGIVVVTINYRVNVFGFLAHPQITAEQPDAPANFGHLDQQAATRWVKRNSRPSAATRRRSPSAASPRAAAASAPSWPRRRTRACSRTPSSSPACSAASTGGSSRPRALPIPSRRASNSSSTWA